MAITDGLYPFQISVTTPRPTESLAGRKVRIKFLVYSERDTAGGMTGHWQEIPYDCFKGLVPIRDTPIPGLNAIAGEADAQKSQVYTHRPGGEVLGATEFEESSMVVAATQMSRVRIELRDEKTFRVEVPGLASSLKLTLQTAEGMSKQFHNDRVEIDWRNDWGWFDAKFWPSLGRLTTGDGLMPNFARRYG